MKEVLLLVLGIVLSLSGFCQNLVPNHSFENIWSCPESHIKYPVRNPYPEWLNPNNSTPDIFHICSNGSAGVPENFAGSIYPYDGSAYAGIVLWEKYFKGDKDYTYISREYIQTKLKKSLKRGKLYCVKLYYANTARSMYSTDALGVALTKQQIYSKKRGSLIIQMPQIINKPGHVMENTTYWEEMCGVYRAKGNETYLTIGNFLNNKRTNYVERIDESIDSSLVYAYYFIDNVSVFEIENSFECGCLNDLAYGSDWMAEDFDPTTGYNSLKISNNDSDNAGSNSELADNLNNNNDNINNNNNGDGSHNGDLIGNNNGLNSGNNTSGNSDSNNSQSNSTANLNNSSSNLNNGNGNEFNNSYMHDKDISSFTLKESEINSDAFSNARIGDKFNLNRIFFEFNSSELLAMSFVELDKLYEILTNQPNLNIEIRGHTDDIGSTQYNKTLSVKRAAAVYNYLLEKGINKNRMKHRGFGNKVPISDNDTEEGRSLNRRVEIIVISS